MGLILLVITGMCVIGWVAREIISAPDDPCEKETCKWHADAEKFRKAGNADEKKK